MSTPLFINTITDNDAILLSWRMVMVMSLLVGFNTHSILSNLRDDYKALCKYAEWPERVAFFSARTLGLGFLVASLVVLELPASVNTNCNTNTRFAICAFFLSHAFHHLQLGLRLLSFYQYRWDLLVLQSTTCAVIIGLCIFVTTEIRNGLLFPSSGCVLVLDSSTLPDEPSLLILAILSVSHQLFTSLLAIVKLFRLKLHNERSLTQTVSCALLANGIPYWVLRLVTVFVFFLFPTALMKGSTVLLMSAFSIHTAFDVQLSAAILRYSPSSRQDEQGISSVVPGEIREEKRKTLAHLTPSILPRWNLFSRLPSATSTATSFDAVAIYPQEGLLGPSTWNQSDRTLVEVDQMVERWCDDRLSFSPRDYPTLSLHLPLTTSQPSTRRSAITRSIRTIFSSSSRIASVIQFYQDSPVNTPSPTASKWTVESKVAPKKPPPGWI